TDDNLKALFRNVPVKDLDPVEIRDRRLDILASAVFTKEGDTPAATGPADLGSNGSRTLGGVDDLIHVRRRDIRRKTLSQRMSIGEYGPHRVPITCDEGFAQGESSVANAVEYLEYRFIAVDVPLGDLPIVS